MYIIHTSYLPISLLKANRIVYTLRPPFYRKTKLIRCVKIRRNSRMNLINNRQTFNNKSVDLESHDLHFNFAPIVLSYTFHQTPIVSTPTTTKINALLYFYTSDVYFERLILLQLQDFSIQIRLAFEDHIK